MLDTLIIENNYLNYICNIETSVCDDCFVSCLSMYDSNNEPIILQIDGYKHSYDDILTLYRNFVIMNYTFGLTYEQNLALNDSLIKLKKKIKNTYDMNV